MRSFALLTLSTALAFAACNEKEPATSATEGTTAEATTEPQTTAEVPDTTTSTTTGETTTTTTGMTTELIPTTGPELTTTTTTGTTADETTTTTTTTGEPQTSTTTGTVLPSMGPYESCNVDAGVECTGNAVCVDMTSTMGSVMGSFCAPKCMGMGACPTPMDLDPDVQAICAFDTDMDMMPDICALLCILANDDCPEGSACEDIGIPEMQMIKFGVCTFPA